MGVEKLGFWDQKLRSLRLLLRFWVKNWDFGSKFGILGSKVGILGSKVEIFEVSAGILGQELGFWGQKMRFWH